MPRRIILILLLSAACFAATRPLALEDYYRLVTVQSPAMSPDGRWVVFLKTSIIEDDNRRQSELWIVASDGGSAPRRLSDLALNVTAPRWSPDGELLAFSARARGASATPADEGDDGGNIWFLRLRDGQADGPAFQVRGVGGTPVFSPDNHWIAFTRRTARPRTPSYASEAERKINERFKGRAYEWLNYRYDQRGYLPDPRSAEATPPREIYVVPRDGGEPRKLTQVGVDARDLAWRPDSQAIAFIADTHARDEYSYERADVFTVTFAGTTQRLTDGPYDNSMPAWSPDGRSLAFRRELGLSAVIAAKQDHGAPTELFSISADGGGVPQRMTAEWDLLPGAPRFAPDGRHLYFTAGVGGNEHLFRVATASGPQRVEQVTRGERRLSGFSASQAHDRLAYIAADSAHPGELFVANADGGGEKRLTSFNDALLSEVQPATAERIVFPSKDGTEIEGWVIKPRGYDAARAWPLILTIHGGPHGAFTNDFSFEHQLLAAHGYLVLYTNPRGSTNYGEKFLWATWGGWGNLDTEDVLGGIDYVQQHYNVDRRRLGVTGYSYGGFLTNWIIGHSTRFAAAVVGAGPSNWISDYGTADIPRTKESEFFGAPWEPRAQQLLLRQSPVLYASEVRTPTLFVHGESDLRVPIEQGEQMYTALRKHKVPARFVRYPNSYHGGWSPWNTVHRYYEELQWWQRWLGPSRPLSGTIAGR